MLQKDSWLWLSEAYMYGIVHYRGGNEDEGRKFSLEDPSVRVILVIKNKDTQ